jgi:predicted dehydrogenase
MRKENTPPSRQVIKFKAMEKIIRWGILGTGNIAKKFAADLRFTPNAVLAGVGSRSIESANRFAKELNAGNAFGSYEALAKSNEVDVIYISTPHTLHYENTLLCLENGKAVLCEKPFAITAKQAKEMIAMAKQKQLFLMEAMWMKCNPIFLKLLEMVHGGTIGKVVSLMVNFGFTVQPTAPDRLTNQDLGGGTIMDIGVYNTCFALSILGKPTEITAMMTPAPRGADAQCAVNFGYENGALAQLISSFSTRLPTEAFIGGTLGSIKLGPLFYRPKAVIEHIDFDSGETKHIAIPLNEGTGYQYEATHVGECLRAGKTESNLVSFADTLLLMETLDLIREKAGISYKEDELGVKC